MDYDYVNPHYLMLQSRSPGSDHHYARAVNPPIHPGAMKQQMPQYHSLPDQRRIERVPRPLQYSPPYETIPGITFSVNGWAGVRVKDILADTVIIDAANDAVFERQGWRTTVLNLEWPGYDLRPVNDPMRARIDVGGMTRQNLAREICGLLFYFHKIICRYPIAPECSRWVLTADPGGIRVTDIVLLSIHYYRNVWIPELYVIEK